MTLDGGIGTDSSLYAEIDYSAGIQVPGKNGLWAAGYDSSGDGRVANTLNFFKSFILANGSDDGPRIAAIDSVFAKNMLFNAAGNNVDLDLLLGDAASLYLAASGNNQWLLGTVL